jgi:hypothetical protein
MSKAVSRGPADPELLRIVREDLDHLEKEWHAGVANEHLRITSSLLRRLLVDGQLQRAWIAAGFTRQPIIAAPDFDRMLASVDATKVVFALAGGGLTAAGQPRTDIEARFLVLVEGGSIPFVVSAEEARAAGVEDRSFRLGAFVEGPCAYARGVRIKRRELIAYVANKLGGAHYDSRRDPVRERAFVLLDEIHRIFDMAGRTGVYYELLGIAQQITAAEDVRTLRATILTDAAPA